MWVSDPKIPIDFCKLRTLKKFLSFIIPQITQYIKPKIKEAKRSSLPYYKKKSSKHTLIKDGEGVTGRENRTAIRHNSPFITLH